MNPGVVHVLRSSIKIVANAAVVLCLLVFCYAGFIRFRDTGELNWLGFLGVNTIFVCMYVARRDSQTISTDPRAWLLAFAGTLTPLLMRPTSPGAAALLGDLVQGAAIALIIVAVLSLRRSFGIVAAHRGIETGGLYRLVRHPLYAAELLLQCGFLMANPSWRNGVLWACEIALQVLRARTEERFLSADPVYGAYLARVRYRFLPGLV